MKKLSLPFFAALSVVVIGGEGFQRSLAQEQQARTTKADAPAAVAQTTQQLPPEKSAKAGGGARAGEEQKPAVESLHLRPTALQDLANRYAPIIFHARDEPNFPSSVDWFLKRTSLWFYDVDAPAKHSLVHDNFKIQTSPQLAMHWSHHGSNKVYDSYDLPDRSRKHTFYLKDVADADRKGNSDSADWITYLHWYPNDQSGITIQYWRFYPYNGGDFGIQPHGGDWEGIHVVLNGQQAPVMVRFMGHQDFEEKKWADVKKEGDHPKVYPTKGGHASRNDGSEDGVRQETWDGGKVKWPDGHLTTSGGLLDVGENVGLGARNGQYWIYYGGLWGSPGSGLIPSHGYWGASYNNTKEGADGFMPFWCAGRAGDLSGCYSK